MDISVQSTQSQVEDRSWLLSEHGTEPGATPSVILDVSAFDESTHYPNGYIPSGTALGEITATGLYGPYSGTSDEVQTVTEGGSGLTSFTLTLSGQTTGSLDDQATAAQVQTALEALSTVGAGNVLVTGAAGGPYTVRFVGDLLDTNVAQMTATPTGGTGTVTVATTTAGGADGSSDGREVAAGLLFSLVRVVRQNGTTAEKVGGARLIHGFVDPAKLPFGLDAAGQADLPLIHFSTGA